MFFFSHTQSQLLLGVSRSFMICQQEYFDEKIKKKPEKNDLNFLLLIPHSIFAFSQTNEQKKTQTIDIFTSQSITKLC